MAAGERDQAKPLEEPIQKNSHDILVASLHEQLSSEAIAVLQTQGAELELERALDEALELCFYVSTSSVERG